jgi:hypothetical protein
MLTHISAIVVRLSAAKGGTKFPLTGDLALDAYQKFSLMKIMAGN